MTSKTFLGCKILLKRDKMVHKSRQWGENQDVQMQDTSKTRKIDHKSRQWGQNQNLQMQNCFRIIKKQEMDTIYFTVACKSVNISSNENYIDILR